MSIEYLEDSVKFGFSELEGLEDEIDDIERLEDAIQQMFQLHIDQGVRFYRKAETKDQRDEQSALRAKDISWQVSTAVIQNAIYALCHSVGQQNVISELLSNNIQQDNIEKSRELIETMMSLSNELAESQIAYYYFKSIGDEQNSLLNLNHQIDEDVIIYIINNIPKPYFIKWMNYVVNTHILPLKNEMYKVMGEG